MVPGTLTVTCEAVPELSSLRREWLDLEARAQASVFLSWQWVGHWLHLYRPTVHLLRVRQDGRTLGLGLVVEAEERRHGRAALEVPASAPDRSSAAGSDLDRVQRFPGRAWPGAVGGSGMPGLSGAGK